MQERLQKILKNILDWWNKFSTKQKTFIVAAAAGVIIAVAVIASVLTRPQYVLLLQCDTTKEASEVSDLLDEQGLDYKVSDDGYRIQINRKQQSQANLLLGANDIQAAAYTIDNVTSGGFSTTEADKQKRYELYLETRLADDFISMFSAIKSAKVDLNIPTDDGTLIAENKDTSAWILLELDGEFTTDNAAYLAKAVSKAVGNDTDENVVILDTDGNMLFSGDDSYSASGTASSQLGVKTQWETVVKNEVRQVLLGTNEFDKIEVKSSDRTYSSESTNDGGGVPGTDSNGDSTEYVYQDSGNSSSTVEETENNYLPNERITTTNNLPGVIDYDNSTIAVTAISYNVVREEDVKPQGLLDGISWEEYKLANAQGSRITVDNDILDVVSKATGFPAANIAFVARTENVFFDKEGLNISASNIVQIILIIIILALLAFVVLRSMRGEKASKQPEELPVESLLQSQPEIELEDISAEEGSETKKLIEKFVDENPEAVANLLRNWLNQEWG